MTPRRALPRPPPRTRRRYPSSVTRALPLLLFVLAACTPFEEPTYQPGTLPATIVRTLPEDDENNVPGTTDFLVEWDRVPQDVTITMRSFSGIDVDGTVVGTDSEVTRRFVPSAPLDPDRDYRVRVEWADGRESFEFETSLLGRLLDEDDIEELPELSWAVLIEPFGDALQNLPIVPMGTDFAVLLGVQEDSEPETGLLHLIAAPTVPGSLLQDQCTETTIITAGPDGVLDTADDAPAVFENPRLTAAGERFVTGDGGEFIGQVGLQDWELDATVLPNRQGLFVHSLSAHTGTWGLDGLIPDEGPLGPGATFCDALAQYSNQRCVRCPSGTREDRCIRIELSDYEGEPRASDIRERTCVDIIDSHFIGIICPDDHERYDQDGDGYYELCPEWHAENP